MPQTSYSPVEAVVGQLAIYDPANIDSLVVTVPAQLTTVVTAGTPTDGVYSITVVGEEGTFVASHTRSGAETTADVTDALAAAWLALGASVLNIATMVSDTVDTNVLTFLHAGQGYTVTTAAPAPGTLVATLTTDPNGVNIPIGIGVTSDDGEFARLLVSTDSTGDFWGVTVRNAELVQELGQAVPSSLEFLPADALSVMRAGEVWVIAESIVAVNDPVHVRDQTGSEGTQPGALRTGTNSSTAFLVPGKWKTATTAPGQLAKVLLNTP